VGPVVAGWVDAALDGGTRQALKLAQAIAPFVDDEFRRHARVSVDDQKQVVFVIDRAEQVFMMRTRWLSRLRFVMDSMPGFAGRPVQFRFGDWGMRIPLTKGKSA
jgi:hypothetical protein